MIKKTYQNNENTGGIRGDKTNFTNCHPHKHQWSRHVRCPKRRMCHFQDKWAQPTYILQRGLDETTSILEMDNLYLAHEAPYEVLWIKDLVYI